MSLGNLYALSRALMHESTETLNCNSEQLIQVIITGLPASADRLEIFSVQANDSICSKLIEFCKSGWPSRNKLKKNFERLLEISR